MVLLFAFNIGFQILGALFPGRWRLVFAAAFIFLVFRSWQGVRDKVPDKFFLSLFRWLGEADVYCARPDLAAIPLVVDPARLETPAAHALWQNEAVGAPPAATRVHGA